MKCWSQLIIDVDYSPADPGINNWFCESSEYSKAELEPGTLLYGGGYPIYGNIVIALETDNGYKIKGFPTQRLFNNAFAAVNEAVDGLIRIE